MTSVHTIDDVRRRLLDAIVAKKYPQQQLLHELKLKNEAGTRGLSHASSTLESYERSGVFVPMLRFWKPGVACASRSPRKSGQLLDARSLHDEPRPLGAWVTWYPLLPVTEADVEWPDRGTFVPWKEYGAGLEVRARTLYHPFQLIWLAEVQRKLTVRLGAESLTHWDGAAEWARSRLEQALASCEGLALQRLRELTLIVSVEDRYLPEIRGVFRTSPFCHVTESWFEWRSKQDLNALVEAAGWGLDEICGLRRRLVEQAYIGDPNRELFPILRMLPYNRRECLRGTARIAWDCYEAVEVLSGLIGELAGEHQRYPDDLWSSDDVKKRVYDVSMFEINYVNAEHRALVLRRLGLDTRPRVLWLVEGDAEYEFINEYCLRMGTSLVNFGVELVNLKGKDRWKDSLIREQLKRVKRSQSAVCILLDNDDQNCIENWERLLRAQGIYDHRRFADELDDDDYALGLLTWRQEFESGNFTTRELIDVIIALNPNDSVPDESDVAEACERSVSDQPLSDQPLNKAKAFAKAHLLRYDKPAVARELARRAAQHATEDPPPIVRLIGKVIMLASRLVTGEVSYEADVQETADVQTTA